MASRRAVVRASNADESLPSSRFPDRVAVKLELVIIENGQQSVHSELRHFTESDLFYEPILFTHQYCTLTLFALERDEKLPIACLIFRKLF